MARAYRKGLEDWGMRATLEKMLTQIREFFAKQSKRSKITIGVVTLAIIAIAIVAVILLSRTNYVTLITAQTAAEAGEIRSVLVDMGVPVQIDGNRVLVPENRVNELGAILAYEGVTGPPALGLEVLNMAASFNVTDSHARKLYEYQRANDIRTSILQSPRIQNAIVIVNIGQTSTFVRPQNTLETTASVMLTINGGGMLTDAEAQTIAELVRATLPGLKYENIAISDSSLHRYRIGEEVEEEDLDSVMNTHIMLTNLINRQTQAAVEQLITPIFGLSGVSVQARVVLNFDRVVVESVEFDPPVAGELDGIARSSSDIWEAVRRIDDAEGIPGTDTNAMGTVEYPYGTLEDNEYYARMVRERNYEINETRTLIEKEQGYIESLYISVSLDSNAMEEDYTAEVTNLISRGLGIPLANVAVERMPFQNEDTALQEMYDSWKEYDEQMKQRELLQLVIKYAVILLLGIAFIVLVVTIYRGTRPVVEPEPLPADGPAGIFDYIIGDEEEEEGGQQASADIEEIALQKKSSGLEQIERFIDKDPAAVAALLRNWLTDEE